MIIKKSKEWHWHGHHLIVSHSSSMIAKASYLHPTLSGLLLCEKVYINNYTFLVLKGLTSFRIWGTDTDISTYNFFLIVNCFPIFCSPLSRGYRLMSSWAFPWPTKDTSWTKYIHIQNKDEHITQKRIQKNLMGEAQRPLLMMPKISMGYPVWLQTTIHHSLNMNVWPHHAAAIQLEHFDHSYYCITASWWLQHQEELPQEEESKMKLAMCIKSDPNDKP